MDKRLYRDESRKMVGGVCAGLSEYLNIDVSILRAIFLLALILKGGGGLIYIVLWIVLPKKDYYTGPRPQQPPFSSYTPPYNQPFVDYTVPPASPFGSPTDFSVPPVNPPVKKGPSNTTLIAGLILTLVGIFILIDEFDIIPDWDFRHLWPIILIIVGVVLVSTGFGKKEVVEPKSANFTQPETNDNSQKDDHPTE
jgi:phage shock protein C